MLCPPSLIYLVISLIALVGSMRFHNVSMLSMLGSFIFILLWTWLLNFLCYKKYESLSWILLLLPLILFVLMIAVAFEVSIYNSVKNGMSGGSQPRNVQYKNVTAGYR